MQIVINQILTNYQILEHKNPKGTMVILHGWGRSFNDWIPTAKYYNKNYKVILLDLPGFGGTAKPETDYSIYDYADHFEAFCKKLDSKDIIFMGHSFGGRIGIISASRLDLIKKLILIDSGGIEKKGRKVKIKRFIAHMLKPLVQILPRNISNKIIEKFGSSDYNQAGKMKEILRKTIDEDLTPLLKKIKSETLIVWGSKDTVLPISHAKKMNKEISNSELRIVWTAGHHPHFDKPNEFLEILDEFL